MADPASYRPAPQSIPTSPGVYCFKDAAGRVIYVGKAKNLRNRLNSYFGTGLHFRTNQMVHLAAKVEWTVVQNELEALQLEYTWIKQYDPRFNVRFRDDKSYPWVAITVAEEFPRVFVGRGKQRAGVKYFGPYAQAWAIRQTLDTMLKIFPMRSCTAGGYRAAKAAKRPCLFGDIGKCAAPCVGRISAADHRKLVNDISAFLSGNMSGIEKRLMAEMQAAAANLEFERAGSLRDALNSIKAASEKNAIVLLDGTNADVMAFATDELQVAIQVFQIRNGRVLASRGWVSNRLMSDSETSMLDTFLLQYYVDKTDLAEVPPMLLVPELPSEQVAELVAGQRGTKVEIRVPQRGEKARLLQTVQKNAAETLAQHRLRRTNDLAIRNQALTELAEALDLASAPLRIECYDISHIQGQHTVGSMVVFEDGLPKKNQYRSFVLKESGNDDFKSMAEVLTRRLRRLAETRANPDYRQSFSYQPALIVVDGGLPQVNAAQAVIAQSDFPDIAVCGLAKRLEEIWLPGAKYPVILSRSSEGLFLLQRLRDEAHRFAISHHRKRRSKAMTHSVLSDIPGLGKAKQKALLAKFSSVAKIRKAELKELQKVPGIGPKLAENIKKHLAVSREASKPVGINMTTGEVLAEIGDN